MIRSKSTQETMARVKEAFTHHKRAFYSRFGDGDVFIMMGNSQKLHQCSPALQAEMIESFQINDPLYIKGLAVNYPKERGMVRGIFAPFRVNRELENFLISRFNIAEATQFESAIFLHYLAIFYPQQAIDFLDEFIRPKKKLFIGSVAKHQIERLIGDVHYYVQTPPRDSFYTMDQWWPQVQQYLDKVELVIPATGMSTRVINKRLWNSGVEVQSFDIGSLVDAIELKPTRKWIRLVGHRTDKILLDSQEKDLRHFLKYWQKEIHLALYSFIKQW